MLWNMVAGAAFLFVGYLIGGLMREDEVRWLRDRMEEMLLEKLDFKGVMAYRKANRPITYDETIGG